MATATVYFEEVGGYAGPARCYQLDPPVMIDGRAREFVTVYIVDGIGGHMNAKVVTVAATVTGAVDGSTVQARAGSFALHDDYDGSADYVAGAHFLALQMLGGYSVRPTDAEA